MTMQPLIIHAKRLPTFDEWHKERYLYTFNEMHLKRVYPVHVFMEQLSIAMGKYVTEMMQEIAKDRS